jgi:FF domain
MPEVTYESTWDTVRPLVANKDEFKALDSEEERIAVFDKVIRRLREKRDEEKRYREQEGSARGSSKREWEESTHRDGRHESKSRRRYEDDDYEQSRERSQARERERGRSRDRDHDKEKYRERSRGYSHRDEFDYVDEPRRERSSKRKSEENLRPGDRKVPKLKDITNRQRSRREGLDYGEREDGEVSEEGEIPD